MATVAPTMTDAPTRLTGRQRYELAVRIAVAWRAIRRGASTGGLLNYLYGTDDEAIEQGQMDTLDLLAMNPPLRMSEIADALRVDPSTATRAVQRLVKAGLAQRRPGQEDGRVVQVELTDAGKAVYQSVFERRVVLMTDILSHYTVEELPVLTDMLERFVGAVDEFVESRTTPAP